MPISDQFIEAHLSHSFYFHSTTANQILHGCTIPFVFLGLIYAAHHAADHAFPTLPASYAISAFLVGRFLRWDVFVAAVWTMVLFSWHCLVQKLDEDEWTSAVGLPLPAGQWQKVALGLGFALCALLPQGAGHLIFEKRLPAFRLYEAALCTPFLCTLLMLSKLLGYRTAVVEKVRRAAPKWKGSGKW